ncbi:hypothetical protein Y032_0009g460 [Ancylostoma ceylanicum]|uniref:SCP domain-containing protein n=1 Tax=Ancylostoma ceylanicum TaxID=53326 RepID=A0A016VJP8_9BILA|nr:hypothetical protein Y032_0009g460 [Ancylostoma ceylanicum]
MRLLVFLGVLVAGSFATAPDYQCWNFGQTNDIRHIYLTGVNKLREAIPKGEAPNKGGSKCPKGKNIYKLNWDCILESYAQETVDKCEEKPTLDSKLSSELSIVWNKTTLTTCNPTPLLKEQAKHWWSEVETVGLSTDAAFAKGLENFAVLANGLATRIGCAQKNCNGDLHMACLVYGKAPTSGQAIYELGEGCADNKECTTYKESKCLKAKKLCEAGYPGEEAVVPPTAGPEAPPTTSASTEAAGPGPQPEQPSSTQKPTTSMMG